MCHSTDRKFNLILRSSPTQTNQVYDCSGFVARYIKQNKRYKMKVVYFGTTENQGNVANLVVHMPFIQTENSQVINGGDVMTTPTLLLHHQAHSSHLVYTGDAQTEYVGTISTTQFQVYITTSDMVSPVVFAVGTTYLLQLQFEELDEDD